jgi:hypothetical protein
MGYQEKRGGDRVEQSLGGTLELASEYVPVRIRNLSAEGAMVDGVAGVLVGEPVSLQIAGTDWIEATVAWSMESRCGLAFSAPIDPDVVRLAREPVI